MIKLFFCMIVQDRLETMRENMERAAPWVDEFIIVDGGSKDGTREWLLAQPKVHLVDFPWCDSFVKSRNQYLNKLATLHTPGDTTVYLRADDDEFFSDDLLRNARPIVTEMLNSGYNQVRVRANDVVLNRNGERLSAELADFYKPLINVWEPGMRYDDTKHPVHETLIVPDGVRSVQLDDQGGRLYYEHRKQEHVVWVRGLRNFFIAGGGIEKNVEPPKVWTEFKDILSRCGNFTTYHDLEAYLAAGQISPELRDWFIKYRKYGLPSYDAKYTEVREGFLTYFLWHHPEQLPQELIAEDKDYMNYPKEIEAIHGEQPMAPESLTYVCITAPNLAKMQRNIAIIMPYVDRAVVVIGRRDAEAEQFLKSVPNLKLVYREWSDSFRDQYQVALNHITGGWMLWLDDDELPSADMLNSLRPIIQQSQGASQFDTVGFPCLSDDGTPQEYHRELLTAWNPNLRFEIHLHQGMVGKRRGARAPVGYFHPKDELGGMRGSCRNWFIGGSWADTKNDFEFLMQETGQDPRINPGTPLNPQPHHPAYPLQDGFKTKEWVEMKDILACNHPEVKYFGDLNKLITSGKVCPEFVAWAERNNRDNNKRPGMGELHSYYPYIKHFQAK